MRETVTKVQRAWAVVIRDERKRRGETQTTVAERAGVDQKVVSKVELGNATLDTTVRIAVALELTPAELAARAERLDQAAAS